uniref:Protein arginine N-methyltransferase domain-containing protein n=1 Tax=Pygocentrus nattereri TaxID=42514 RepID=A0AAR2KZW3_PYGNA
MPNEMARSKKARRPRRGPREPREDPARNELISRSLESAQQCLLQQDYGTAFVHYLLVLNLAPVLKDFARESFRFTLFKWADELDSLGRIQDLFDCYEQAVELFPTDEVIVNSMGEHLFRMGFRDEAAAHFHKALKLRPDFPEAKENFYRVANWLVERWHFLMLNDHGRNRKYQLAIQRAVQEGCSTVLDIGTGTGILGVSLVVTETVDAGLLGEGIIESLIHAWKHLLLPPPVICICNSAPSQTGRVIPGGATVFGMAVECQEIRRHHRLCVSAVGGLDLEAVREIRSPVSCSVDADESAEPYTTERLSRLPGGFTALTGPCRMLDIDFNNVQELESLCSRKVMRLRVPVTQEGVVDALAVWFQLHLDQENSISTGPQENTCWEQAIYPVQSLAHCSVKRNDELLLEVSCRDAYLRLCCVAIVRDGQMFHLDSMEEEDYSTVALPNPEVDLCSALASLQTRHDTVSNMFTLECSEIALLNNVNYHNSFRMAVEKLLTSLRSSREMQASEVSSSEPFYMLDVSEGFSVLSLLTARLGQDSGSSLVQAYSSVEKDQHQALLRLLAQSNGVEESALQFWLSHVEDDSAVLQRPASEKLWSAIVLDCIETCGLIRQRLMEKATLARCLLEDGGRIFPERIVIHGLLVESDTLLQESAVQGTDPTLGFNIAPFINQFTVPVHVFLDLSTLECTHLSDPVELFTLDLMNSSANYISRGIRVRVSAPGKVTAVPFWYQIYLDADLTVTTFSQDSHWKQAAVVLQCPLVVNTGDWVQLTIQLHKSSISITAVREEAVTADDATAEEEPVPMDHPQGGLC